MGTGALYCIDLSQSRPRNDIIVNYGWSQATLMTSDANFL